MLTERLPIDLFIFQCLAMERVQMYTSGWRVDPKIIQGVLVKYFREMGIFFVSPNQTELVLNSIIHHLQNSLEINEIVARIAAEEVAKHRQRERDAKYN